MSINQCKSQASGAQSSNSVQLDVTVSANAGLHPYTISPDRQMDNVVGDGHAAKSRHREVKESSCIFSR